MWLLLLRETGSFFLHLNKDGKGNDSYLGCLTSGAPDLEGKNRKNKERNENRRSETVEAEQKLLSQGWTAVCDRHPAHVWMSKINSK